ncbi:putative transcription factor interactor and regulator CCHC(Zn) family [Helianthus annuus]|nr:putative transcription factor interactor and regulator CCHC(Zn) family [Helianthus annuus]
MTMVFDEKENDFVGKINDFGRYRTRMFNQDDKHVWTLRLENFACQQNESLKEMKKRFDYMIERLKSFDINLTDTEQTLKLEAALSAEWDDVLKELKQKPKFSKLHPSDFINKLQKRYYKNLDKKKILMNRVQENLENLNLGNLDKINLDVITEIDKRICICYGAKHNMRYDYKRGCYIDENLKPLDFVKIVCAGTYKKETKDTPKNEESVEVGYSSSASACSKCDSFKTDNEKLIKNAESLALEIKKLKEEKQADEKQILMVQKICEKLKAENDKLLVGLNSLTFENTKLKDKEKCFEKKIKDFEIEKTKNEKEFQNQLKLLEDGRNVFSQNNIEKQKLINSHLQKIIELEKEGEHAQKKIKELEKEIESKQKSSEDEDFWIKLENKNLKANESKFQEQIKVLEDKTSVLENLKIENENSIKSHLERISHLEEEAKNSRTKIDELEKKLISFAMKSDKLNIPCPKPINSVPISDNVTNFDSVKVEDCDETPDDENVKKEKEKLFVKLKEKFQKTVLQSTEEGECSKQKSLKKKAEQKQKDNKSSSSRSSNQKQILQKIKNENSKFVGNKWCRSDHSAKASNPANMRKEYHQAKQCYDLNVWNNGGNWYTNRMCYSCGYHGHIAVNCQYWSYETRRCFNCNIKGHIARDCPRKSSERLRVNSQKTAKIPVKVKPQEQKVLKPKVPKQSTLEKKVKLSQGQKDRLRKKRKKAREYLEKILSSDSQNRKSKSSDESISSIAKSSKTDSSDTNLRTKEEKKKKGKVGDESDRSKSDKPPSGNDSGSLKPEEPLVEVKKENSGLAMDDANFPPLLNKNSKSPKDRQAWVNLFK